MTILHLAKLHATGNDFLVLDETAGPVAPADGLAEDLVAALCDRHRGVGADGLIVLRGAPRDGASCDGAGPGPAGADVSMVLHNADGGRAEMSGNGIRCLAHVAVAAGHGRDGELRVATDAGLRTVRYDLDRTGRVVAAEVDMGPVTFDPARIPVFGEPFDLEATFHGVTYRGDAAGMGNPHLVLFVDDPERARVDTHGSRLERDERFPQRTNVEFVSLAGPGALRARIWERGVGETLSCGTGACAAAAVAHRRGLVGDDVVVHVPGGVLRVGIGSTITLAGPVRHVFDVTVDAGAIDLPARTRRPETAETS